MLGARTAIFISSERQLDREGQVRTRKVVIGPGKHFSAASTADLEPCQLSPNDLELDNLARGCILLVRVVVGPVRTGAVQLVVEDPAGRVAPLSLYHVPARFTQKEIEELWPVGAVFGVKEPLLRTLRAGYHIRVDSPADLVRLFPSSPHLHNVSFPRSPTHPLDGKPVAALKEAGNAAFKRGRWIAAKEGYQWALSEVEGDDGEEARALRAAVLSNLALTNLKLSYPRSARRAAQEGLDLLPSSPPPSSISAPDPLCAKLLYRLALSLFALECYAACLATLEPLIATPTPDALAASLASRARASALQAAHGPSPRTLRALFTSPPPPALEFADFLSPLVGIRPLPGRGHGLIALAPIPRGTLLAAVKPLAAAGGARAAEGGRTQFNAGVNLWTRGMDPWAMGEVGAEMLWRESVDGDEGALAELWAGEELGRASEREGEAAHGAVADASRAEGVVTFNAFHVEDLAAPSALPGAAQDAATAAEEEEEEGFHARVALYPPFPSALNHSCVPTASYTFLRGVFLLRARVDLAPGTELTDSYVDAAEPLEGRERKLAPHGFVCQCALCVEERAAGRVKRAERARLAHELEAGVLADPEAEVVRLRGLKPAMEGTYAPLTAQERAEGAVRPALYPPARALAARLVALPGGAGDAHRREAIGVEIEALRALGAVLEPAEGAEGGERWERPRMVHPPRVGDTNAVLSALFVARVWKELGREEASRHWIALARAIEAGQGGVELFALRFGPWARRQGLDLPEDGAEKQS
ncbi:hypothetical protein JCM10449v2_007854 [Rhodotorula kratochvilovae]